jgi:hypothetical protein
VEAGVFDPTEDGYDTQFLASARVLASWGNPSTTESGWIPFVGAGITVLPGLGTFNVGAGVEYWGRRSIGLRLDSLAHTRFQDGEYVLEARAGIVFRRSPTRGK